MKDKLFEIVSIRKDGNEVQCVWDEEYFKTIFNSKDKRMSLLAEQIADNATELMRMVEKVSKRG